MRKPKQPSSLRCLRIFWLIPCILLLACMGCNSISRYGMDAPSQPGAKTNSTGARGDCGCTALHEAAAAGNLALAEKLIQEGAEVDGTSKDGVTPFHWAAWYGHVAMANLLLEHGADVNKKDTVRGRTALHKAAENGQSTLVQLLLQTPGIRVEKDFGGYIPPHEAARRGHGEILRMLLTAVGSDVNAKSSIGSFTPIHEASLGGHPEIVKMLIEAGADVNAATWNSTTPIHIAAQKVYPEIVRMLIEAGADVNVRQYLSSTTPIHIAAQKGYLEIVQMLIEAGADVNARKYPLLLEAGADVNARQYPLLLKAGANVNTRQYPSSTTPLEEAAQNGHSEAANELMRAPKIKIGSKEIRKLWMYKIKIEPETRQALWRNKTEIEFE